MPAALPSPFTKRTIRASAPTCASCQMPRSSGLIRPSAVTAVASVNTRPAPPMARVPRWTRCQSFANPSELEYWHMGETTIRLGRVRWRRVSGSKRCGITIIVPDLLGFGLWALGSALKRVRHLHEELPLGRVQAVELGELVRVPVADKQDGLPI